MPNQSHRGVRAPSPLAQPVDRRVSELDVALSAVEAVSGFFPLLGFAKDAARSIRAARENLAGPSPGWLPGTVVHPLPFVNWYKVQVGDGNGWISACAGSPGSLGPHGPREIGMFAPNDRVLVFKPRGLNYGIIACAIPSAVAEGKILCPDWVSQGSGVGLKREPGHKFVLTGMYKSGGVIDFNAHRPQDQLATDRGWVSPFGPAITLDDFMAQVRVSEQCGLWVSLIDNWMRLAGVQTLIESAVHEEDAGDDEGESRYFRGVAGYPNEALGLYASGVQLTAETDDKAVQYTERRGKLDLPKGEEDTQPFYRYQEYAGYLGQGHLRMVAAPPTEAGKRRFRVNDEPDFGLFMESIGFDGAVTSVSAKSYHIGKRCGIIIPKAAALSHAKAGDDAERGGYKFSGRSGTGPDHEIGDVSVTGELKSMLRAAAVQDLVAHACNWKALHPFHYHTADYRTWQQRQLSAPNVVQEAIDYSELADASFLSDPEPVTVKIDHRYGDVEFFQRESFIHFHDDGTVQIVGGQGEQIVLGGGGIILDAPGGIQARPGTDFIVLADQVAVRAKGSVDVSSTEKDVRLKAERNFHVLAGSEDDGGVLIESRSHGSAQEYTGKFGEDVRARGIVLKAANSVVATLSKDVYLRTGGADLGDGDIVLDAARGSRAVRVYCKEFNGYVTKGAGWSFGPVGDNSTVRRTYWFGEQVMIADVRTLLGGGVTVYEGGGGKAGVVVAGSVRTTGSISSGATVSDRKGGQMGKVPDQFVSGIESVTSAAKDAHDQVVSQQQSEHESAIVGRWYADGEPGNETVAADVQFGFRDGPVDQYRTSGFKLPESRWQMFARLGLATGGATWTERPVSCRGEATYPWPGRKAWTESPSFLRLESLKMFDPDGRDKDRPEPYTTAELSGWENTVPDGNYALTRS